MPLAFATVFDGLLPASLNPGVDQGAPVVVWTPEVSGVYAVMFSAPDEPDAPFEYADAVLVDVNAAIPGVQTGLAPVGTISQEFQRVADTGASISLTTPLGDDVRAVVKVALVASASVPSAGGMIVPLDELKAALGIALADTSENANLVQLEEYAAAWVEERLERRFRAPAERTEYLAGNGTRTLFLWGNVEDGLLTVTERAVGSKPWLEIEDPDEVFELRTATRVQKLERVDGSRWARGMEYKVVWNDGFTTAPADIRALVIDAVNQSRNALIAINDEGTVKSETIGDYSYTLDLSVAAGALSAGFTGTSNDTINRWRRVRA